MYKFIALAAAAVLLASLTACASTPKTIRVKCPACGYEFDVQPEG